MKIIKKGKLPGEVIWAGTCYYCESELEAKQAELKVQHCQREGSWGEASCPLCQNKVNFYEKK